MPEKLVAALDAQLDVLAEVKKLRASNRLLAVIVGLLLVIVILLAGLANYARLAAQEARGAATEANRASASAVALNAQQEADRVATSLIACRLRNANNRDTRNQFLKQYDLLAQAFDTTNGMQFVADLRATVPTAAEQDRDCQPDGVLDANDYPLDSGS